MYIGSSVMPLGRRLTDHRAKARAGKTSNLHKYMREVGPENVRLVLIEAFPCESKEELVQREQYWLEHATESFPSVDLQNQQRAHCTIENRRLTHIASNRRYFQTEKGRVVTLRYRKSEKGLETAARKRAPFVCRCGCTVSYTNRFRHKRSKVHKDALQKRAAELIALLVLNANLAAAQNRRARSSGESPVMEVGGARSLE